MVWVGQYYAAGFFAGFYLVLVVVLANAGRLHQVFPQEGQEAVLFILPQMNLFVGYPFGIGQELVVGGAAQMYRLAHYHGYALAAQYQAGYAGQRRVGPGSKSLHREKIYNYFSRATTKAERERLCANK